MKGICRETGESGKKTRELFPASFPFFGLPAPSRSRFGRARPAMYSKSQA